MKLKNVIIPVLMFLCIMSFASATYWTSYGGDSSYMTHASSGGFVGRMDLGANISSVATGYTFGSIPIKKPSKFMYPVVETLVFEFGSGQNYLVIPDTTKLEIYNEDLYEIEEVSVGQITSQVDLVSFESLNSTEVVGVYEYNNTLLQFQTYTFNATIPLLSQTYSYDIPVNSDYYVNGVRCKGASVSEVGECYFTITEPTGTTFYYVNTTDLSSVALAGFGSELPIEPLAWIDTDNDGDDEFLLYNNRTYVLFEKDGVIEVQKNHSAYPNWIYEQVLMFQNDFTYDWRFAVIDLYNNDATTRYEMGIHIYKDDGTLMWQDSLISDTKPVDISPNSYWSGARMGVVSDWEGDGDGLEDLYVAPHKEWHTTLINNSWVNFTIYQGYTGDVLMSNLIIDNQSSGTSFRSNVSLTLADMNDDDYYDFIFKYGIGDSGGNIMFIASGVDGSEVYAGDTGVSVSSCVPADLDFDGFLDVICSGGGTAVFKSGGVNQNPTISSVAYSPSLSVEVGETLYAIVNATDNEDDTILYREKCSNAESWSVVSTNPTRQCVYGVVGTYNMSVGVRDAFHSTYDIFSQSILVTETGEICDFDDICEAEQGETYLNCADCSEEIPDTTQSSVNGSLPLPTDLVSVVNTNQGLLPEIYYGTLGFFSSVLSPLIVLVFVVLFVMIILAIGIIIKKIGVRAGSLGGR